MLMSPDMVPWQVLIASTPRLFVELWEAEMAMASEEEKRPPSIADLAERAGWSAVDALIVCQEAEKEGEIFLSESGHLFLEDPDKKA